MERARKLVNLSKKIADVVSKREAAGSNAVEVLKLRTKYQLLLEEEFRILKSYNYDEIGTILMSLSDNKSAVDSRLINRIADVISAECLNDTMDKSNLNVPNWPDVKIDFRAADFVEALISLRVYWVLKTRFNKLTSHSSSNIEIASKMIADLHDRLTKFLHDTITNSPCSEFLYVNYFDKIPSVGVTPQLEYGVYCSLNKAKREIWEFTSSSSEGTPFNVKYDVDDIFRFFKSFTKFEILAPFMDRESYNAFRFLIEAGITVGKFKFDTSDLLDRLDKSFDSSILQRTK